MKIIPTRRFLNLVAHVSFFSLPAIGNMVDKQGGRTAGTPPRPASETSQLVDGSELPIDEEEQLASGVLQLTGGT